MLTFLYKMCFHYISLFFLVLSDFASKIPAVFVLFICPLHCYFFTLLPTRRCWRFAGCTGLCFPTITNVTRFSATWFFFFLKFVLCSHAFLSLSMGQSCHCTCTRCCMITRTASPKMSRMLWVFSWPRWSFVAIAASHPTLHTNKSCTGL